MKGNVGMNYINVKETAINRHNLTTQHLRTTLPNRNGGRSRVGYRGIGTPLFLRINAFEFGHIVGTPLFYPLLGIPF